MAVGRDLRGTNHRSQFFAMMIKKPSDEVVKYA
jgi:hypothetical protein